MDIFSGVSEKNAIMEDFVYIILIVVWLLVSFLRRKPKTQKPHPKPETASETESAPAEEASMEDMLEEFFGSKKKKEDKPPVEEPVFQNREYERERKRHETPRAEEPVMEAVYEDYSGKSGVSDDFEFSTEGKIKTIDDLIKSHKTKEAMELAKAEAAYGAGLSDEIPEFDLRTAVIFSEILNKKY